MPKRPVPQPNLDELFSDDEPHADVKPQIPGEHQEVNDASTSPPTTPRKKAKGSAKTPVKREDSDEPVTPSGKGVCSFDIARELVADAPPQSTKKRWTAEEDALLLSMMEEAINEAIWDKVKAEGSLVHRTSCGVKYHAGVSILACLSAGEGRG